MKNSSFRMERAVIYSYDPPLEHQQYEKGKMKSVLICTGMYVL